MGSDKGLNRPPEAAPQDERTKERETGKPLRLMLNGLSITGVLIALLGFGVWLAFIALDVVSEKSLGYAGISYAMFFVLIMAGAVLIAVGVWKERRRLALGGAPLANGRLIIDLSKISARWAIPVVAVAAIIPLGVVVGSYQLYHITESNEFCGQLCHSVMEPEYVTYHNSSHARVDCVECHIGTGAEWYVRSKISGIRQILAVIFQTFPRPIPTPIHNLRPARETCEECHWPSKFIGYKEFVRSYFLSDEENTPFKIRMLMKIGGEKSKLVSGSGIHYHMLIASTVEYIARDANRQDIPWVRIKHADGSETIYESEDEPLTSEEIQTLELRKMDCMDCHNRPAHQFPTPMQSVNDSIEQNLISRNLPYIKLEATKVLDQSYPDKAEAFVRIATQLRNYYRENYPRVLDEKIEEFKSSVAEIQAIYGRTIFPKMNVNWSRYPDNIGHRDWRGCFRCHNDSMVSEGGFAIFTSCDKCHLILAQGEDVDRISQVDFNHGETFAHPGEDGEVIEEYTECVDCHTGGADTYD